MYRAAEYYKELECKVLGCKTAEYKVLGYRASEYKVLGYRVVWWKASGCTAVDYKGAGCMVMECKVAAGKAGHFSGHGSLSASPGHSRSQCVGLPGGLRQLSGLEK